MTRMSRANGSARSERASRRLFLQGLAAFLGLGWWPAAAIARDSPSELAESALSLLARLRIAPAAHPLGREYLSRVPEEAEIGTLLRALGVDVAGGGWAGQPASELRQRELEARDFAAGRVVQLSGWLLSQSEARVCALAALVGPQDLRIRGSL